MHHTVVTQALRELSAAERVGMFSLRYQTFHVRLGWDVQTHDGQEIDQFDQNELAQYIVAKSPEDGVDACWRLLPTLGPNMLRDTFPCLLHGQAAPAAADVWELSRFAIATDRVSAADDAGNHQIGFGELSVALMNEAGRFARAQGISKYVTVTTVAIERMMKRLGLHIHRLGAPMKIGSVLTVACFIEVDETSLKAVGM